MFDVLLISPRFLCLRSGTAPCGHYLDAVRSNFDFVARAEFKIHLTSLTARRAVPVVKGNEVRQSCARRQLAASGGVGSPWL